MIDRPSEHPLSSWWGDPCSCCETIPATIGPFCEGCLEHVQEDYARGYDRFVGCPVYKAWCLCEPFPWEVAA